MSNFVRDANLPHKAKKLVIGVRYSDLLDKPLKELGIETLYCPINPYIDERISSHVDLSMLHAGGDTLFLAPNLAHSNFSETLMSAGFKTIFPDVKMTEDYPNDSFFNLCLLKNHFFYSPRASNDGIVDFLTSRSFKPIAVKQGYCRCSVCIVDDNSIITSDSGIHSRALENGIDCLLISPGYISLDGFDYGFIGGASFKISDETICFTGTFDAHPDKFRILNFLSKKNIKPLFLTDKPLFDIGSAVPLTEK